MSLRVVLVSSSYHPYVGGVEQHVRQVAHALTAQGVVVEVWTVDRGEHLRELTQDGIRVRYLPTPLPAQNLGALTAFVVRFPLAWNAWRRACREFRPHIVHVHCFGPNGLYALALHDWLRVPLAVTSHGETIGDDDGAFQQSALLRRGLTVALRRAEFVTAPSEYVLDDLRRGFGLTGGYVVPNGVDLAIVPPGAVIEADPYLLGVGRLGRMKGFDLLIDAYAASGVAESHLLVIGGDGPERGSLEAQAERLGLAARVRLLGTLDPQGVVNAMAGARAVVVPSRSEAFGIVALEAWRSGTALVMTNRGGGPEFVHDREDALLVDPEDTPALVRALEAVVYDDGLRDTLAANGSRRAPEFAWPAVADAYADRYQVATGDTFTHG